MARVPFLAAHGCVPDMCDRLGGACVLGVRIDWKTISVVHPTFAPGRFQNRLRTVSQTTGSCIRAAVYAGRDTLQSADFLSFCVPQETCTRFQTHAACCSRPTEMAGQPRYSNFVLGDGDIHVRSLGDDWRSSAGHVANVPGQLVYSMAGRKGNRRSWRFPQHDWI